MLKEPRKNNYDEREKNGEKEKPAVDVKMMNRQWADGTVEGWDGRMEGWSENRLLG